ncbi:HupE/UreJ family protein [Shewanella carassii]|uniref:Urease accessory protein UreJ n=1 Tax=Shewanella carassii TaxID=1987584 RepID=A0ABQ1TEJ1_9GAMM|nr:HupE/UreJ family protein [Shewanella carassii]BCV68164.1 urease accessory protein UreJ [Shewanella carassii]GGE92309.1 urease accessory protein UreJ [Shewanella carassii]
MPSRIIMLLLLLLSLPISAHELHADGSFWDGFNHPVLGFDHLLAMLSVGILSTQLGHRAIWSVPLAFLFFMGLGAITGMLATPIPFVEPGIALSVLLLGLAIVLNREMPISFAMAFVGVFALFHGYAHGVEMPELARPGIYAMGFLLGTAAIHVAGVIIGSLINPDGKRKRAVQLMGSAIALVGSYLMLDLWLA